MLKWNTRVLFEVPLCGRSRKVLRDSFPFCAGNQEPALESQCEAEVPTRRRLFGCMELFVGAGVLRFDFHLMSLPNKFLARCRAVNSAHSIPCGYPGRTHANWTPTFPNAPTDFRIPAGNDPFARANVHRHAFDPMDCVFFRIGRVALAPRLFRLCKWEKLEDQRGLCKVYVSGFLAFA